MRQIYRFETESPPRLTEQSLRAELERRQLRFHTAMLALGAMLVCACLLAGSILLAAQGHKSLAALCVAYLSVAMSGGAVLTIVVTQKRKELTAWPSH